MVKLALFLTVTALIAQVYAQNYNAPQNVTKSKIEDTINENCVQGTAKWTEISHGMGFECDSIRSNNRKGHYFYTDMNAETSEGFFSPIRGRNGYVIPGALKSYKFGGCVDSVWGTYRCAFYNRLESMEKVIDEPKICTADGAFCFDNFSDTCIFYFANLSWERNCGNLKAIEFNVTENLYKE